MSEAGLEKGHIGVSPMQKVDQESSVLDLESLERYSSHIKNFNSTFMISPSCNHYYILIPLFNKCLPNSVSNGVLGLGTCNE